MTYEKPNTTSKSSSSLKSKSSKVETKASRVRKLVAAGHKPLEIAAMTGFRLQTVHNTMYHDRLKAAAKAAAPKKLGRPKGSKNKPKSLSTAEILFPPAEIKKEAEPQSLVYIGNPTPNLWTRIKAVFTGRYE